MPCTAGAWGTGRFRAEGAAIHLGHSRTWHAQPLSDPGIQGWADAARSDRRRKGLGRVADHARRGNERAGAHFMIASIILISTLLPGVFSW